MPAPTYYFDPKDPSDTDGFAVDLTTWLGGDTLSGTPTVTVSPSGITINSVMVSGNTITAWMSGGTSGQTYTVTYHVATAAGRSCARSVQLPVQPR